MARFGRLKGKARAQPTKKEQLRVSIPQPKEERKDPQPLSPKNEWVTNVQALKHEYQEKACGGDENKAKKRLSIKVDADLNEQKLVVRPPSVANKQTSPKTVRSPSNSAPSSPKSTRPREPSEGRSPNSTSTPTHRSPRSPSQVADRYSPRPVGHSPKSPNSATKSLRSPKSRYGEDHSTLDLRRKEKLLSKSSKGKSSKKYSSTLHADKKPKTEERTPKQPVETEVSLERVAEARDDISTPKAPSSSKRDTVLGVLTDPHSPLPTPRMPPLEEIKSGDPSIAPKGKKQGWFGFRKGKGKDSSKLPPNPTSSKDTTSKPPTPITTETDKKVRTTPRDSSQPSSRVSTPVSSTDAAVPAMSPVDSNKLTSPLQLQLWLGAVKASIVRVRPNSVVSLLAPHDIPTRTTPSIVPRVASMTPRSNGTPRSIPLAAIAEEENQQEANNNYFLNAQEYGVYVDYSTFDDGDSVSSIALLFKWLTCRDLGDGIRHRTNPEGENPEGMVVSDHEVVDSDVSFDAEAQPRRRVLFSP